MYSGTQKSWYKPYLSLVSVILEGFGNSKVLAQLLLKNNKNLQKSDAYTLIL